MILKTSMILLGLGLLAGCCTTPQRRADPNFPVAASPEQRYKVHMGDKQFIVDSVRFEGEWLILEGGYPATKALWIARNRVDWIEVPK